MALTEKNLNLKNFSWFHEYLHNFSSDRDRDRVWEQTSPLSVLFFNFPFKGATSGRQVGEILRCKGTT